VHEEARLELEHSEVLEQPKDLERMQALVNEGLI
jgi:hypothetical protein